MVYFGFKSYENELIKEVLDNSKKDPIELIKSFSPVPEEEIGSINAISSCEMFFSEEAYTYKIYWGLIIYFLENNRDFIIENKWLKIALLLFGHLEKEIIEDGFLNKNWFSNLQSVKEYIDKNNKTPSTIDKNKEIKILGKWLSHQKANYNEDIIQSKQIMKDKETHKTWSEFINNEK